MKSFYYLLYLGINQKCFFFLVCSLQKARLARIRLAKNASGNAFVSRKKEADRLQRVSNPSYSFEILMRSVMMVIIMMIKFIKNYDIDFEDEDGY